MKPGKKMQRKLERRQRAREKILIDNKNNSRFREEAFRVPGSRNQKRG